MKKIMMCLLIAMTALVGFCGVKKEGNTFIVEQSVSSSNDTETKYTWQDKKGNTYPIYITKTGAVYVKRVSKNTGKEYKQYLSKEVKEQIQQELNFKTNK